MFVNSSLVDSVTLLRDSSPPKSQSSTVGADEDDSSLDRGNNWDSCVFP